MAAESEATSSQTNKYLAAFNWKLDSKQLEQSSKLKFLSFIEGPSKNVGDARVYLSFYPNGSHSANRDYSNLNIGIDYDFPLKCKYKVSCEQLGIHNSFTRRFDAKCNEWSWAPDQTFRLNELYTPSDYDSYGGYPGGWQSLAIYVEVVIREVYDSKNKKVAKSNWDYHLGLSQSLTETEYQQTYSEECASQQFRISSIIEIDHKVTKESQ